MQNYRPFSNYRSGGIPPVVLNIILINIVVFIASNFLFRQNNITNYGALYYPFSDEFKPYQLISTLFLHANFMHIFFNMFTLFSFGVVLEKIWGSKRFLLFYSITGIGASILLCIIKVAIVYMYTGGFELYEGMPVSITDERQLRLVASQLSPVVGASSAIFGIITAYTVLFPNSEIMVFPIPFPIKTKYILPIVIIISIYLGFANYSGDPIAHFGHISGAIMGFILVKFWNKKHKNTFY